MSMSITFLGILEYKIIMRE